MELVDIVKKLSGPVFPLGDASQDGARLDNLVKLVELAEELNIILMDVANKKDSYERSVYEAGETADKYFINLKAQLENYK